MGDEEKEGNFEGMLPRGRAGAEGLRGGLGEDLNRIFISFMRMCQNEIYSFNFICP